MKKYRIVNHNDEKYFSCQNTHICMVCHKGSNIWYVIERYYIDDATWIANAGSEAICSKECFNMWLLANI